jgi:hypothetical protein
MEYLNVENNVRYVADPEKCAEMNSDGTTLYKQATIYCDACQGYQKLSLRNGVHATPIFDAKRSVYYGLCYTKSCLERMEEKAREKQKDDLFFAQEKYLESRCNTADAKCNASNIKYGIRLGNQDEADAKFQEMERLQEIAYNELVNVKKRILKETQYKNNMF